MAKRFVLGFDGVKSSHEIGSVSDQFEQNARGITEVTSLNPVINPSFDVALKHMPTSGPKI
ncbi:MAG: hypothetical protein AAB276_09560 [Pseudomonadota bacterium]